MTQISRDELKRMIDDDGVRLMEVLPPRAFAEFHLPNAINVPLDDEFDQQVQRSLVDKGRTIVVYSQDAECAASRTAAQRMQQLGYHDVFDYEAGKEDWKAARLPIEYTVSRDHGVTPG